MKEKRKMKLWFVQKLMMTMMITRTKKTLAFSRMKYNKMKKKKKKKKVKPRPKSSLMNENLKKTGASRRP